MNTSIFVPRNRVAAAFLALSSIAVAAHATPVVQNGDFTQTNTTVSSEFGSRYSSVTLNNFTTAGYNFVFIGSQRTANSEFGKNNVTLPSSITNAPGGGNILALDAESGYAGAVTQSISGLVVGQTTDISFYYAGTEQVGYTGPTYTQLSVSLGGETKLAPQINLPTAGGFSGWTLQTLSFTPTATTETLSFLTKGGPNGAPPFTLISNVSASVPTATTPEPSSLALLSTGLFGVAGFMRSRFKNKK